jgi:hypothetical protein
VRCICGKRNKRFCPSDLASLSKSGELCETVNTLRKIMVQRAA